MQTFDVVLDIEPRVPDSVPATSVVVVIVNGPAHALFGIKNGNEMVFDVPAAIVN